MIFFLELGDPYHLHISETIAKIVADNAKLSLSHELHLVLCVKAVEDNDFVLTLQIFASKFIIFHTILQAKDRDECLYFSA